MADCPGVLHLAAMADGGLARVRTPAGRLTSEQARTVADAARRLGTGVLDLTNRANLQIRGLALDDGPALAALLLPAGLLSEGEADRRRNILVDPYAGLDPSEIRDLSPLAGMLDQALRDAAWIGALSPKFSFVFDGGGRSGVAGVASDVTVLADESGLAIDVGRTTIRVGEDGRAAEVLIRIAQAASDAGPAARAADIGLATLLELGGRSSAGPMRRLTPQLGAVPTNSPNRVALTFPVPVGRLSADMLDWLADVADNAGEGRLVLAPWSAVVLPGVESKNAGALLSRSERHGFTPVSVAERLRVLACAGAPACERAREPAKALGAALLELAAREPARLPVAATSVHMSACSKGCAGSSPADLLMLGSSERDGWSLHQEGAPRAAGPAIGALDRAAPADILDWLAGRR